MASVDDELESDELWSSLLLALLADCAWGAELAELVAALVCFDDADPAPVLAAAVFADDAGLEEEAEEDVDDELLWLAAVAPVALELALVELPDADGVMFVCKRDEKLCDGDAAADAELAGAAELGPDIISRIAGVMKRAVRT